MLDKRNFYIKGKWTAPLKSNDFDVINPSNEDPCAIITLGSVEDTNYAVKAAKEAFPSWSQTSKEEKISLIQKLYEVYKSRWDEMAESISMEMGAPIDWATTAQTSSGADHIKDFIKRLEDFEFEGSFWDFLHSEFFGSDYALVDLNPLYNREQFRSDMIDVFYESFTDEMRSMLLTDEYDKALIYVSMPYVNIDDTTIIVKDIDQIAEIRNRQMSFENAQMSQLTGGPPVTIAINEGIQETQFDTIKLSLLLVLIAMICVFWSVKYGFITFLPILLVILWYPATVDAGGTNLNIFTAMVGTIIIGIGIDNSIQISERVREEGATPEGIQKAVENTGQSVVEATFTTMGGVFSGVIISFYRTQFVGLRNFFALIITLVLFSLLMAVFALPSFYHALHYLQNKYAKRNWRIKTKFN